MVRNLKNQTTVSMLISDYKLRVLEDTDVFQQAEKFPMNVLSLKGRDLQRN